MYGLKNKLEQVQDLSGMTCVWCQLDCVDLTGLMHHLTLHHDRCAYRFTVCHLRVGKGGQGNDDNDDDVDDEDESQRIQRTMSCFLLQGAACLWVGVLVILIVS